MRCGASRTHEEYRMNAQFNLDELQQMAGLTQAQLAERTGIDPARISRLARDSSKVTLNEWLKLTDALGVPVERAVQDVAPEHGLALDVDENAYADLRAKAEAVRDSAAGASATK